jgi:hypothetical protein
MLLIFGPRRPIVCPMWPARQKELPTPDRKLFRMMCDKDPTQLDVGEEEETNKE